MIDREKVIKGLECCNSEKTCHSPCPYNGECEEGGYYFSKAIKDAIALLKAQEPKPPIITENAYGWKFYHCPSCGREFYGDRLHGRMNKTAFCDKCGQAVKWDG